MFTLNYFKIHHSQCHRFDSRQNTIVSVIGLIPDKSLGRIHTCTLCVAADAAFFMSTFLSERKLFSAKCAENTLCAIIISGDNFKIC